MSSVPQHAHGLAPALALATAVHTVRITRFVQFSCKYAKLGHDSAASLQFGGTYIQEFVRQPPLRSPLHVRVPPPLGYTDRRRQRLSCCARERVWGVSKTFADVVGGAAHLHLRRRSRSQRRRRERRVFHFESRRAAVSAARSLRSGVQGCWRRAAAADLAVDGHLCRRLPPAHGHARLQQGRFPDRHTRRHGAEGRGDGAQDLFPSDGWPSVRCLAHDRNGAGSQRAQRRPRAALAFTGTFTGAPPAGTLSPHLKLLASH